LKISKRLGRKSTQDAINAIDAGDFVKAIEITLKYYDKAYLYGLKKKNSSKVIYIETDTDNIESNTLKLLDAADKISW
jgi:tRNA 2-selenouridine synthase